MIEHGRQHAATATSGCRNDFAAGSIFFRHRQGIGIHQTATFQTAGIAVGMHIIGDGFASHAERSGQHPFGFQTALHRGLHRFPHPFEMMPNGFALAIVDVFPKRFSGAVAPLQDAFDGAHIIHLFLELGFAFFGKVAATNAIHRPLLQQGIGGIESLKSDAIGVKRQKHIGAPHNGSGRHGLQDFEHRHVGEVTFAGGCKRPIKHHFKACHSGNHLHKLFGGKARPHRVTA